MHIAVVGCGHGEVDKIYDVISRIEEKEGIKVRLVLCCGDFQSVRNMTDLRCMACPIKYQHMHDFHRYYSGEKEVPILTLFIGGNHEASNFLQELPYGGWVAPNMFYMGYVGVFKFGPLKIAGISGIYKGHDYLKGRYEYPPYNQSTTRSVYHYRNLDVFRLKQIKEPLDIVLSHDWPKGIHQFGDTNRLLRQKPFFRDEIDRNELGSRPLYEVLEATQPSYWFSAHLHVKFAAYVPHSTNNRKIDGANKIPEKVASSPSSSTEPLNSAVPEETGQGKTTKFLALDKVLPRRQFLQIIEIPTSCEDDELKLQYDPEWLAILRATNDLVSVKDKPCYMPSPGYLPRSDFSATGEELDEIKSIFGNDFTISNNFQKTAPVFQPGEQPRQAVPTENPFTKEFCDKVGVVDPMTLLVSADVMNSSRDTFDEYPSEEFDSQLDITMNRTSRTEESFSFNPDEISIDMDDANGNSDHEESTTRGDNLPTRSRLVLPPPKNSGGDNGDGSRSTGAAAEGSHIFRRSSLVLPPPKNDEDTETMEVSAANLRDHTHLFFLDTSGDEPNVKKRRDGHL